MEQRCLIGISGYKGHGKDSLAKMVQESCEDQGLPPFHVCQFAQDLKKRAQAIFGLSHYDVYDEVGKETKFSTPVVLDEYLSQMSEATGLDIQPHGRLAASPREIMQLFGTEYVRGVRDSYWLDTLATQLEENPRTLVSDLRFSVEEAFLRSKSAFIVRVTRTDLVRSGDTHSSETQISGISPDLDLHTLTGQFSLQRCVAHCLAKGDLAGVLRYNSRIT